MKDSRDERVFVDDEGVEHYMDETGKVHYGVPPLRTRKKNKDSGFTTFDTSQGHCAFCGSIKCNGQCFK